MIRTSIRVQSCYYKITIFLSILFVYIFSGCATTSNISRQTQINDDEGILLTKIHSNVRGVKVLVYDKNAIGFPKATLSDDEYFKVFMFGKLASSSDQPIDYIKVVPIKSGTTFYASISRINKSAKLEPQYFNIVPGYITYVGDLYIKWTDTSGFAGYVQTSIIDNEDETVSEAKDKFPWLFEKFKYIKDVPVVQIETVEGFEEVKELKNLKEKLKDEKDKLE